MGYKELEHICERESSAVLEKEQKRKKGKKVSGVSRAVMAGKASREQVGTGG